MLYNQPGPKHSIIQLTGKKIIKENIMNIPPPISPPPISIPGPPLLLPHPPPLSPHPLPTPKSEIKYY